MEHNGARLSPIPPPNTDDPEDVAWALSTAKAMYARGERTDALTWLRRAAEAASEGDIDDRALELAKATAELASEIAPTPSSAPVPLPSAPAAMASSLPTPDYNPLLPNPLLSLGADGNTGEGDSPQHEAAAAVPTPAVVPSRGSVRPQPAQAIRVVVWRDADGVRIAPQGTRVATSSGEAMLVALDPSADLAGWLSDGMKPES
jgi:hypothetical protein